MWKVAAVAFMPLAAITLGALAMIIAIMPEAAHGLSIGTLLLLAGGAGSVVLALALSVVIARRMTAPQDGRMLRG
jgi:purine-cytosine permease-like protein